MNETYQLLSRRAAELEKELDAIRVFLRQVGSDSAAKPANRKTSAKSATARGGVKSARSAGAKPGKAPRETSVPGQVLAILSAQPNGLKTADIVERLNKNHGRKINMTAGSTYLSILKKKGHIVQGENRTWHVNADKT